MLSGTHQRLARIDEFLVKAKDTVLSQVYQFKYLGVVLDPSFSWNDHVDYIERKVSMRLDLPVTGVAYIQFSFVTVPPGLPKMHARF